MIASSPEAVWAVLTDGAAWPSWDSGVDGAGAQIAPGEKITIRSQAAPGRASPDGTGGTAFRVREEYTGPLLGLIWRSMPDLGLSPGRIARGLKRWVETGR